MAKHSHNFFSFILFHFTVVGNKAFKNKKPMYCKPQGNSSKLETCVCIGIYTYRCIYIHAHVYIYIYLTNLITFHCIPK